MKSIETAVLPESKSIGQNESFLFVGKTCHEIRNQLTALNGWVELAMLAEDLALKREYMKNIKLTVDSFDGFIKDIIRYTQLQTREMQIRKEFLRTETLINEIKMFYKGIENPRVEFVTHVDKEFPGFIFADKRRLMQVFYNLVSNAVKFTQTGVILLNAEICSIEKDSRVLKFEVIDTGVGMTNEDQEKIFEPYIQLENAESHQGSGLGLSICKEIVEVMGGEIGVVSKPGKGSCFWFTVPCENCGW